MRRPIFTILLIILTVSFAVSCQHRGSDDYLSNINLEDSTVIMHADQAYDDFERFYYNNELDSMLEIAPITLKLLEKAEDWFDYYYVWKIKIGVLTQLGDYTKATEEADTMFANATERKNDFGLSMANYAMSEIYGMQENPAEATKFAAKAVDLFPKDLEPGDLLGMYANYCYSAIITNDKVGLDTMFTQWKAIVDKYPCKSDDPDLKNHANWHFMYLYHRSLAWAATGEVKQAEQLIDSLYYYENLEGNYFQQKALITLVQMQIALHKEDYATMLALTDSFELAGVKMNDNTKIVEALDQRSNAFAELGRWKDAYETLLKCKTRNDSIILADNREQLNALNKRFEVNELKMEGERQQMQAERRQLYLVIAIVLLVLVGTVLFAYYRRRTDRRMTAVTAEKERIENELQIARDIQMSMVPSQFPDREGLDMFASMHGYQRHCWLYRNTKTNQK